MTVEQLRAEFRKLFKIAMYIAGETEWMTAVRKLAGPNPTPEQWVEAAKKARTKCPSCRGSGVYEWGTMVNGVMTNRGDCYRCQGTGTQGQEDYKRNQYYDNHHRVY